jgi:uncharacterized protein YbjT (DUF2867 family)
MEDRSHRLCILGATGPTGRSLGRLARSRGYQVRVVSRDRRRLEESFPGDEFERFPADLLRPDEAAGSLEAQESVFDCVGLPGDLMDAHPVIAENVARAAERQGSRCFQVSSFWSYLPVDDLPLRETHPRRGGSEWIRLRRKAEDILLSAGGSSREPVP